MTNTLRPAIAVLGTFLGEECWGPPGPARAAAEAAGAWVDAAIAALRAGEPRRAMALIDQSGALQAAGDVAGLAGAYRNAAAHADVNWVAGGYGSSAADGGPGGGVAQLVDAASCIDPALDVETRFVGLEWMVRSARITTALEAAHGQPRQAAQLFAGEAQQLGQIAVAAGFPVGAAWCARLLADVLRCSGDATTAAALLGEAQTLATSSGAPLAMAGVHLVAGDWCVGVPEAFGADPAHRPVAPPWPDASAVDAARQAYAAAEALARAAGSAWMLAVLAQRAGALAWFAGELDESTTWLATAEEQLQAVGDEARTRSVRIQSLIVAAARGAPQLEGPAVVDEISSWALQHGSRSYAIGLAATLVAAGQRLGDQGDAEAALACLDLADRMQQALGAGDDRISLLGRLAELRNSFGQRAGALAALEESFVLAAAGVGEGPFTPGTDEWLAAAQAFQASSAIFLQQIRGMDPDHMQARADRLIALGNDLAGDAETVPMQQLEASLQPGLSMEDMQRMVRQAVAAQTKAVTRQARVMVALYQAVRRRDNGLDGADALFAEALAAAQEEGQGGYLEAVVLGQQGRFAEAAPLMRAFVASAGYSDRDAFETHVSVLDWPAARAALDRLVVSSGDRWWTGELRPWEGPTLVAELHEGEGDLVGALQWAETGAALFEQRVIRLASGAFRTALADDRVVRRLHLLGARVAGRLGGEAVTAGDAAGAHTHHGAALRFAELARSRSLLDLIAARLGSASDEPAVRAWQQADAEVASAYEALADAWSRADDQQRLTAAQAELAAALTRLIDRETELRAAAPEALTELRAARARPVDLDAVQRALPADAVVLEYVFGNDELQVLAIGHDGSTSRHTAVPTSELRALLAQLHRACRSTPAGVAPQAWEPLAERAATLLLDPVSDLVERCRRLVVVPFGPLHAVPLHALPFGPDRTPLGAQRVLSYLPALGLLGEIVGVDDLVAAGERLVIGDPAAMATGERAAPALTLAGIEARVIAAAAGAEALVGAAATEQAVRERVASAAVLHAATHGIVDGVAPMRSAILLAHGEALTVAELLGLSLDADLVVLSACETGLGQVTAGDDVLGLTRGVIAAGARRAVVSLWPVWDDLACVTMCRFHELLGQGTPPAIALQQTQQEIRSATRPAITARVAALTAEVTPGTTPAGEHSPLERVIGGGGAPTTLDHPNAWAPFVLIGV